MKSRCGSLTRQHDRLLEDLDTKSVLHLCSVCELSGAPSENRRILYRQNELQETLLSLFPICRRLPKLDVAARTRSPAPTLQEFSRTTKPGLTAISSPAY